MKSHFLSSRRFKACALTLAAAAWLAVGCGNNGGIGDGVYDNSIPPGGASGAGRSGSSAGAPSSHAGAVSHSGAAGSLGNSGAAGASGGAAGSAGKSGGGGAVGIGGAGGSAAGMSGGAGLGAGGSTAGGGSLTCGNGTVEAGEACDSGMQNTGGAGTAGAGTAGGGGDDQSGAGAPPVVPKYGQICSNTCTNVGTQACLNCEFAGDCFESVDNCLGVAAPFNAAQQAACYTVMSCIQKNNCFDGTNTLGKCYCGSLSTTACGAAPYSGAGAPDGVCIKEIQAGFPTLDTNSKVLAGLLVTAFPSGAAMKRLSCQKGSNEQACLGVCGFTAGGPAFP